MKEGPALFSTGSMMMTANERRSNIWNYKLKSSYKTKNKELAEVTKAFNVSSRSFL